jgi:hypothetical protein
LKVETVERMSRGDECALLPKMVLPVSSLIQSLSFRFVPRIEWGVVGDPVM